MIIEVCTREDYDWTNETMRIVQTHVAKIDEMRMNEITQHYDCDMSELKAWLDMKNRAKDGHGTNSDRVRSMTDEELADFILVLTDCARCIVSRHEDDDPEHYCNDCKTVWLDWLKQEAKDG